MSEKNGNGAAWFDATSAIPCPVCLSTSRCRVNPTSKAAACLYVSAGHTAGEREHDGSTYYIFSKADLGRLEEQRRQQALQERIAEVERTIEIVTLGHDRVFEVRILGVKPVSGRGKPYNAAGYYRDKAKAARDVAEYEATHDLEGIYILANEPDPSVLARSPDRITDYLEVTTSDNDIKRRHWLLLDCDPKRPRGVPATDAQMACAERLAADTKKLLTNKFQWPDPVEGMSGNGHYLLYLIDLPNDKDTKELLEKTLKSLDQMTGQMIVPTNLSQAKIDTTTYNAARVMRLLGTVNCKGYSIPGQPHRQSKLLVVPDLELVTEEQLRTVADLLPDEKPKGRQSTANNGTNGTKSNSNQSTGKFTSKLKIGEWLTDNGVTFRTGATSAGWEGLFPKRGTGNAFG